MAECNKIENLLKNATTLITDTNGLKYIVLSLNNNLTLKDQILNIEDYQSKESKLK